MTGPLFGPQYPGKLESQYFMEQTASLANCPESDTEDKESPVAELNRLHSQVQANLEFDEPPTNHMGGPWFHTHSFTLWFSPFS